MRLIDADALDKEMEKAQVSLESNDDKLWKRNSGYHKGLALARRIVRDFPTIEAEPVRHGQNVTYTHPADMFMCSECGFTCEITELRDEDEGMSAHTAYEYDCKFCPHCGAKMDADERSCK